MDLFVKQAGIKFWAVFFIPKILENLRFWESFAEGSRV